MNDTSVMAELDKLVDKLLRRQEHWNTLSNKETNPVVVAKYTGGRVALNHVVEELIQILER